MQVVVAVELPKGCAVNAGDEVSEEEVNGVLLGTICEGVAVVSSNRSSQFP